MPLDSQIAANRAKLSQFMTGTGASEIAPAQTPAGDSGDKPPPPLARDPPGGGAGGDRSDGGAQPPSKNKRNKSRLSAKEKTAIENACKSALEMAAKKGFEKASTTTALDPAPVSASALNPDLTPAPTLANKEYNPVTEAAEVVQMLPAEAESAATIPPLAPVAALPAPPAPSAPAKKQPASAPHHGAAATLKRKVESAVEMSPPAPPQTAAKVKAEVLVPGSERRAALRAATEADIAGMVSSSPGLLLGGSSHTSKKPRM